MTSTPRQDTEPPVRIHALFPDTPLDILCPPALARLVTGRAPGRAPAADAPPAPDGRRREKGAAR
ncbi:MULTISPECIES: hypothetical protein [Streptomyces]|uniref:hypothetical protein n=1 Tax=Streptomyces TaxID=1883 RepID=UPI0006C66856|nr:MULTISPECIES: hypothetical protein [Streptomyces]KOV52678.1 hypothetical protein ADL00_36200 [Streptomyces sp. AS58]